MNKIVNKFLLTGEKFIPELHLQQPGLIYIAGGSFTKHLERNKKFRETSNLKHIYKTKLSKACFVHDVAYSHSKDLTKRTISDVLKYRANEIAINPKYDIYQRVLASMIHKLLDQKTGPEAKASANEELAQKLHKSIIKKFKRMGLCARFRDNIWASDLAEMGLLSSKTQVKYLLCVIDVFGKYAVVKPLENKKSKSGVHSFVEIVKESDCKPNKLWVHQGRELYNNFMQK